MPERISLAQGEQLRHFFSDAGYNEESLVKTLGIVELPSAGNRNVPRLLDRTSEPGPLTTLLRWFWMGMSQPAATVEPFVPAPIVDLLAASRLLSRRGEQLVPEAMVMPYEGFLIASDLCSRVERDDAEVVIWPNPTTRHLLRFTIRRPSRQILDLGTGSGILALKAASHSENVVASDLNPQAVEFARFNACLNGVSNIEFLQGDSFAPVAGRKFDLIFSNPPFFITPGSPFLFCDNPMELDQMCRHIAKHAPAHLEPGGYFQMLCEWVQVSGQDWHERLGEWFEGTGCDAWVMKSGSVDPSQYAQERIMELMHTNEHDARLYEEYMTYYRQRRVETIHRGFVAMRRRPGHNNWVVMEDMDAAPQGPFGDAVERRFTARDLLTTHSTDEQILGVKLRIAPDVRLEQIFEPSEEGWRRRSLALRLTGGLPSTLATQPIVAEFLASLNGSRTLGEVIDALIPKVDGAPEQVRKECVNVSRKLIESGFLIC
jgi:methylase of polypeptide subunit release factors